jgi:hypothetical protein
MTRLALAIESHDIGSKQIQCLASLIRLDEAFSFSKDLLCQFRIINQKGNLFWSHQEIGGSMFVVEHAHKPV